MVLDLCYRLYFALMDFVQLNVRLLLHSVAVILQIVFSQSQSFLPLQLGVI